MYRLKNNANTAAIEWKEWQPIGHHVLPHTKINDFSIDRSIRLTETDVVYLIYRFDQSSDGVGVWHDQHTIASLTRKKSLLKRKKSQNFEIFGAELN